MRNSTFIIAFLLFVSLDACNGPKQSKIIVTDSIGKVETIDPNKVLMTLPTIENTFPEFENKKDTNNLTLIEDDWRQLEFITKDQEKLIDQETDSVKYIFEHEVHKGKDYYAFNKLYVRNLITNPINLPFEKILVDLANGKREISGISINNNDGQVKNGFSLSCGGMNYYGLKDENNNVTTFCIYGAESDDSMEKSIDKIAKFLKTENLFLIDWTHKTVLDENNIHQLLSLSESK